MKLPTLIIHHLVALLCIEADLLILQHDLLDSLFLVLQNNMLNRYTTENFFKVKLSQQCLPIATSGDPLEEFVIYLEQVPTNEE